MLLASQTSLSPPRVNFQTFLFLLLFALCFIALARQVTSTSTTIRFLAQPEEMAEKGAGKGSKKKEREGRKFDFSKHASRHIAIELSYLGWDFKGFASQEDTNETIEGHLFAALSKTCLIPSRASSSYSRCARTDKGVSALGQVVSLRVRSKLDPGDGIIAPSPWGAEDERKGNKTKSNDDDDDDDDDDDADDVDAGGARGACMSKEDWLAREEAEPHPGELSIVLASF